MSSPNPGLHSGGTDWRGTRQRPQFAVRVEPVTGLDGGYPPAAAGCPVDQMLSLGSGAGNDLVLSGNDVQDFHGLLEPTERGPQLSLVENAAARVNGRVVGGEIGLKPGDSIEIGTSRLVLTLQGRMPRCDWRLLSGDERASVLISQSIHIGSDPDCELRLDEPGVSQRHARLVPMRNTLWVQDLAGAGTLVNDEPIRGAQLLQDGDRLSVGRGAFLISAFPVLETTGADALEQRQPTRSGAHPVESGHVAADAVSATQTRLDRTPVDDAEEDGDTDRAPMLPRTQASERLERRKWAAPSSPHVTDPEGIPRHPDMAPSLRPVSPHQLRRSRRHRSTRRVRPRRVLRVLAMTACVLGAFLLGLLLDRDLVSERVTLLSEQIRTSTPGWLATAIRGTVDDEVTGPGRSNAGSDTGTATGTGNSTSQTGDALTGGQREDIAPLTAGRADDGPATQISFEVSLETIDELRMQLQNDPDDQVLLTHLNEMAELYRLLEQRAAERGDNEAAEQYRTLAARADPGREPIGSTGGSTIEGSTEAGTEALEEAARQREAGAVTTPPGDNAIETLLGALAGASDANGAGGMLNAIVAEQLTEIGQRLAAHDFERADRIVSELANAGLPAAHVADTDDPLAPAQRWHLQIAAAILEADAMLRQVGAGTGANDLRDRFHAALAEDASAILNGELANDVGQILTVAAREARWAARDDEAAELQSLINLLSEPAPGNSS